MSTPQLLAIYLKDHHAAANGGVELVRRILKSNSGNAFHQAVEPLAAMIVEDRRALEEVMEALGVDSSRVKDVGAWLGEKLGRFKLNGHLVSYSPLSRVVELEALAVAINVKLRLWRGLQIARQSDERLAPFDFDALAARASQQLEEVEALHLQAAEIAFVEASQSGT